MKSVLICPLLVLLFATIGQAQGVGVGTLTPHTSAILEIKSSTKGLILPRTSTSSRLAMTGVKGLTVYDTSFSNLYVHNGSIWQQVLLGPLPPTQWSTSGNNIHNTNTGNVGIGITSPLHKLSVAGDGHFSSTATALRLEGTGSATTNRILFDLATNTTDFILLQNVNAFHLSRQVAPFGYSNDIVINDIGYVGFGTAIPETKIHIINGTDVGNGSGGYLQLGATNSINIGIDNNEIQARSNGAVARLTLQNGGGAVQIGVTNPPAGYLLSVNGKVICEELKIQDDINWPDYVFSESYELRTIAELANYIQEHHRLPNIPSAATIASEGIIVGDMQTRMMEKIEELTLYIIQLQVQINQLQEQINQPNTPAK